MTKASKTKKKTLPKSEPAWKILWPSDRAATKGDDNRETLGWRVHMRCLDNGMEGLKHKPECGLRMTLDLATLVATR